VKICENGSEQKNIFGDIKMTKGQEQSENKQQNEKKNLTQVYELLNLCQEAVLITHRLCNHGILIPYTFFLL